MTLLRQCSTMFSSQVLPINPDRCFQELLSILWVRLLYLDSTPLPLELPVHTLHRLLAVEPQTMLLAHLLQELLSMAFQKVDLGITL